MVQPDLLALLLLKLAAMFAADVRAFDLERLFLGDGSWGFLLEIVVRTGFIYVYATLLLQLLGKRGRDNLSAFDLVIIIALGSATGDAMFVPGVGLLQAMTVITMVVLLQLALFELTDRSKVMERFLESEPMRLIKDGRLDLTAMD